jgi:hypothetical protein
MRQILYLLIFSAAVWANTSAGDAVFRVSPGGTLDVSLSVADIIINIWNKNEVMVSSKELDRLNITSSSKNVTIRPGKDIPSTGMQINIPSHFNIKLKTSAGEHIINGNIKGNIDIENSGGDITFNDVNGSVSISTGGGDVKGHDVSGSALISSSGGDIRLNNIKGTANIETGGGNIKINNSRLVEIIKSTGGNLNIREAGGNGRISTGGGNIDIMSAEGNLEVFSSGGNIRINETSGRIDVKNNGGDIRIREVGGSIKAFSQAGDIFINFGPDTKMSSVSAVNGDIRVGIDPNLNADITARKKDPNWWRDQDDSEEAVKSDFKLTSLQRNKRSQEVIASYQIKGGGAKINLETNLGDIIIRKL